MELIATSGVNNSDPPPTYFALTPESPTGATLYVPPDRKPLAPSIQSQLDQSRNNAPVVLAMMG